MCFLCFKSTFGVTFLSPLCNRHRWKSGEVKHFSGLPFSCHDLAYTFGDSDPKKFRILQKEDFWETKPGCLVSWCRSLQTPFFSLSEPSQSSAAHFQAEEHIKIYRCVIVSYIYPEYLAICEFMRKYCGNHLNLLLLIYDMLNRHSLWSFIITHLHFKLILINIQCYRCPSSKVAEECISEKHLDS